MRTPNYKISYSWRDKEEHSIAEIKNNKSEKVKLENIPTLLSFKSFIAEVETIYKVSFNRTIDFMYCSKGVKDKKSIQKWLLES